MMTPTVALNRFAAEGRKHNLYLKETRDELHYGFRTGDLKFLLKPLEKVEVIETIPPCPVPNTPGWLTGIISLRGDLLPVFDINFLITKTSATAKWILVFRHSGRAAGIYIDTLPAGIKPECRMDNPSGIPEILQGCVENVYRQGESIWLETDFEKLFMELRIHF